VWGNIWKKDIMTNQDRHYKELWIKDLEDVFNNNKQNKSILQNLHNELAFRKKNRKKNQNLFFKISNELNNLSFKWPSTDPIITGDNPKTIMPDKLKELGLLKAMEYKVGKGSTLKQEQRINILSDIYNFEIPEKFKQIFKDEIEKWGHPKSAPRLKKIAVNISSFVKNVKKKQDSKKYEFAIYDWESDLKELKKMFYDGVYDFKYPTTDI